MRHDPDLSTTVRLFAVTCCSCRACSAVIHLIYDHHLPFVTILEVFRATISFCRYTGYSFRLVMIPVMPRSVFSDTNTAVVGGLEGDYQ